MATKHFYPVPEGLVDSALRGTVASNANLGLLASDKVVFDRSHPKSQVSVLCGGGSGHEPAHSGYVGKGMLAAAVCGDVFASPSAKQVQNACKMVPSDQGFIFIVTNYTGDMLHFGLAAEKMKAEGYRVEVVKAADDVAVGRKNGGMVGRRGLCGTIIMDKILGSCASAGASFETTASLGHALSQSLVTVSAGLDHCHVPGRSTAYGALDDKTCEIGMGIHNEPGARSVSPIPPIDTLIQEMLRYLIDSSDLDRAYLPFDPTNDQIVLVINNLGGVSTLEIRAITQVVIDTLKNSFGMPPIRVVAGTLMTSLNAPGFSISLLNCTYTSKLSGLTESDIIGFFDADTDALCWPKTFSFGESITMRDEDSTEKPEYTVDLVVDPEMLKRKLRKAAQNIIENEPQLTEWDTVMGDGDCGTTIEAGARALLEAMENGVADSGSLLAVVSKIVDITEDKMGGTLGAVFGIFFAAFFNALKASAANYEVNSKSITQILGEATLFALNSLRAHTPAKQGDRTVMDVMIPYANALQTYDIQSACNAAFEAAEGTRKLQPKLGRATYVGGLESKSILPPDPGAYAVYELIKGLSE
ncbi:Dak1p [Dipodascopsis uninucleata]